MDLINIYVTDLYNIWSFRINKLSQINNFNYRNGWRYVTRDKMVVDKCSLKAFAERFW